jgi:dTDP-4-amino-4,6-dideoxygalactose transaminase
MADMDPIMEIARHHGLHVVEDAAQAHGAEYKGKKSGSIGDVGCFSFYPGKNLGAYGEAGAVVTNDPEVDKKVRMLRDHGQAKKYDHTLIGWNSRMDGFQGAILSVKLKHLYWWNEARRDTAKTYNDLLLGIEGIITPTEAWYNNHVYHIYAIRAKNRDEVMKFLAQKEIYCGIHYPVPVHLQKAYEFLGYGEGTFPVAEKCADEYISLPMYPEISRKQIEYVAQEIEILGLREV